MKILGDQCESTQTVSDWPEPNLTRTVPTQILFQLTKREIKDLCKSITEQQPDSDVPFYLIDLNDVQEKVWLIYYK